MPPPYYHQLEQRFLDLKAWNDRSKQTLEHREVFKDAMSRLVHELDDGAKETAQVPENMEVLCLLISAEIWMKESNLILEPWASFELFALIAQGAEETQMIQCLPDALNLQQKSKLLLKAQNIVQTANDLFSVSDGKWSKTEKLSIDFICSVHAGLMAGLGVESDFRTVNLGAAGINRVYVPPLHIGSRLLILCDFMNDKWDQEKDLQSRMMAATLFLSEFLFIHPFKNGNGRLARLLFSWVLRNDTVVPVSLTAQRDEFIDAIYESQGPGSKLYRLAALVAKCAAETAWNANYVLSPPMDIPTPSIDGEKGFDVTQKKIAIAGAVVAVIVVILGLTRSRRP